MPKTGTVIGYDPGGDCKARIRRGDGSRRDVVLNLTSVRRSAMLRTWSHRFSMSKSPLGSVSTRLHLLGHWSQRLASVARNRWLRRQAIATCRTASRRTKLAFTERIGAYSGHGIAGRRSDRPSPMFLSVTETHPKVLYYTRLQPALRLQQARTPPS